MEERGEGGGGGGGHNILRKRTTEAESNQGPSTYQLSALPLGQTGSQGTCQSTSWEIYSRYNQKNPG